MRLAVVGHSEYKIPESSRTKVREKVQEIISDFFDNLEVVISGGASGVDTYAEEYAKQLKIPTEIHRAEVQQWDNEGVKIGFKNRNMRIALSCDTIISVVVLDKDRLCYHCNKHGHEKSGACWTAKQARRAGKSVHIIEVPQAS